MRQIVVWVKTSENEDEPKYEVECEELNFSFVTDEFDEVIELSQKATIDACDYRNKDSRTVELVFRPWAFRNK